MLPKIDLPTYDIKIPSTGNSIQIRPFLVKEEKLLLMALESKDENDIINTTLQVIKNCIISGDVDLDKLPFFDIDYLFIALRAKSVGDSIDIKFTCNNVIETGHKCGNTFPAKIDISNCKVVRNEDMSPDVMINGQLKIKMKYPTYAVMKSIMGNENVLNKKIKIIVGSIDYVQERDKVFSHKDVTKEELTTFVEQLTQEQYKRLEQWVDNFPSFVVLAEADCNKCGFHHKLEYKEFSSFFV